MVISYFISFFAMVALLSCQRVCNENLPYNGMYVTYYPNKVKSREIMTKNCLCHGSRTEFHQNGRLKSTGFCKEGRRVGVETIFDSTSSIIAKYYWDDDSLQRGTIYFNSVDTFNFSVDKLGNPLSPLVELIDKSTELYKVSDEEIAVANYNNLIVFDRNGRFKFNLREQQSTEVNAIFQRSSTNDVVNDTLIKFGYTFSVQTDTVFVTFYLRDSSYPHELSSKKYRFKLAK